MRRKPNKVKGEIVEQMPHVKGKTSHFIFVSPRCWRVRGTLPDANHVHPVYRSLHLLRLFLFFFFSTVHTFDLRKFKSRTPSRSYTCISEALGALEGVGETENWFLTLLHASQIERDEPESERHYERSVVANDNEQTITT